MGDPSTTEGRSRRAEEVFEDWLLRRQEGAVESETELLEQHPGLEPWLGPMLRGLSRADRLLSGSALELARPPAELGEFRLIRPLGRGGMGVVWEAEQRTLGRRVALKLLATGHVSDRTVERFRREAEACGKVRHPAIVTVYGVGEHEGTHYIAQELVEDARTFAARIDEVRRLAEPPRTWHGEVARLVVRVADALELAHAAGVVHRDVKPENILLTPEGEPKVADFGLASVEGALALSRTGDFAGTAFYMSPEQVAARRIGLDHRTDVFSLGATMYEALTLRRPFDGDASQAVLEQILLQDPPPPHAIRARVPRDLGVICMKALEKNRERRYESMAELAADVRRHLDDRPILARPPGPIARALKWSRRHPGAVALAVALLVLGVLLVQTLRARSDAERARDEARTAQANSERALGFFTDLFEEANPFRTGGGDLSLGDLLEHGSSQLDGDTAAEPHVAATMRATLGLMFLASGRARSAEAELTRALGPLRTHHGAEHPRYLEAVGALASVHVALGQYASAEPMLEEVLSAGTRVLPADHPMLVHALHALGVLGRETGHYTDSEEALRDALARSESRGPAGEPSAVEIRCDLLATLVRARRVEAAREVGANLNRAVDGLFGKGHPLGARASLEAGRLDRLLGDSSTEQRRIQGALATAERSLGIGHPITATIRVEHARLLLAQGKAGPALEQSQHAVADLAAALGDRHPHTLEAREILASLLVELGDPGRARDLLAEVVETREDLEAGEGTPSAARRAWAGLVAATAADGDVKVALGMLSSPRASTASGEWDGLSGIEVESAQDLGWMAALLGRTEHAREALGWADEHAGAALGEDSRLTGRVRARRAAVELLAGAEVDSPPPVSELLSAAEGASFEEVWFDLEHLAKAREGSGSAHAALPLREAQLELATRRAPPGEETARRRSRIGRLLCEGHVEQGDAERGLASADRAIDGLGEPRDAYLASWLGLLDARATALRSLGRVDEAIECYDRGCEDLPDGVAALARSHHSFQVQRIRLLESTGLLDAAEQRADELIGACRRHLSGRDERLLEVLTLLALLRLGRGEAQGALVLIDEALDGARKPKRVAEREALRAQILDALPD